MGGQHTWENLVTACSACNHHKGGRTIEQAQMKLRRNPCVPPASAEYIFGRHLKENKDWQPFVQGW
jgi:5-methylcytosine-specific restriction endonuclease McrA